MDKDMKTYEILVPIIKEDLHTFSYILPFWKKYLPIKKIVFVGPREIKNEIDKLELADYQYIDEETVVKFSNIKSIISNYTKNDEQAEKRTGWYLQQFIKMQYAFLCEEEYYLIWDSDTVPLHVVNMLDQGVPIFHMKEEYNQPYFETLKRLLGDDILLASKSYISEHMLINCKIMRELIGKIEENHKVVGNVWYEKIIYSIDRKDIKYSGFSEFETYGTYVMAYHPELYRCKEWKSERSGYLYFEIEKLDDDDIFWMGKQYDAVSFEKTVKNSNLLKKVFQYKWSHVFKFTFYLKLIKMYDAMLAVIRSK